MVNDDIVKRQSRRRTLLCCSSLCLFCFLILFIFLTQVFRSRDINFDNNLNRSISLNVMKFRSSLFHCGQSVVRKANSYKLIEELTELMKKFASKEKNNEEIFLREEIIIWLEYILNECFQARQFSIIEQEKATIIRKIISFLRQEFLYIAAFFIKEN